MIIQLCSIRVEIVLVLNGRFKKLRRPRHLNTCHSHPAKVKRTMLWLGVSAWVPIAEPGEFYKCLFEIAQWGNGRVAEWRSRRVAK